MWKTSKKDDRYILSNIFYPGEVYEFSTYASSFFLEKMWNENDMNWKWRENTITVTSSENYVFLSPPTANWRVHIGDSTNVHIQFYVKKGPNRFQRWLYKKVFGLTWNKI